MKRLYQLFLQDLLVTIRSNYPAITFGVAGFFILLILFVVPENVKTTPTELYFDDTNDSKLLNYLLSEGLDPLKVYSSEDEMLNQLQEESNGIAVKIAGDIDNPQVTISHHGGVSEKNLRVLDACLVSAIREITAHKSRNKIEVVALREQSKQIPFDDGIVPLVLVMDVVMLGFLLIAVLVFQEKQEGSIYAYRITPANVFSYIFSKSAVILLYGIVYTVILVVIVLGINFDFITLLLLVILPSLTITYFGLFLSVFFKQLARFFLVGSIAMEILILPFVSYLYPSFAPEWITYLPSYPMVFGVREVLFPTGKEGYIPSLLMILGVEAILMFILSYWAVSSKLMKEGK